MFILQVYTINNYSGVRNDEILDDYYLVGIKDGVLKGFYIGRAYTIKDTMRLMGKLGYRPAHYDNVAKWGRGYIRNCREWEEENYQVYLDSFPDGDRAHWDYDITHVRIEYIKKLDIKPYEIYLYLDN